MGFETMHGREFYLAKAKEHPLLEEIIAGKKSFIGSLEEVLSAVEVKGGDALEDLRGYLSPLSELSGIVGMNPMYFKVSQAAGEYAKCFEGINRANKKANKIGFPSLATSIGALILSVFVPPAALAGMALCGAGGLGIGGAAYVQNEAIIKETRAWSTFQEAVGTVREAAGKLDSEIVQFFAVNTYINARQRFEQTYPSLSDGQRQSVDSQLHSYLAAGGIPGMDEQQLREYLGGLIERGVAPDA